MLFPVIANDIRAGIRLVAQRFAPRFFFKSANHFNGEAARIYRQRLCAFGACQLPMASGGVFAGRNLGQARKRRQRAFGRFAAGNAFDIEQPHFLQHGRGIFFAFYNGGQGVRALIAKLGRVWHLADAKAVQHNQKHAFCHRRNILSAGTLHAAAVPCMHRLATGEYCKLFVIV